MVPYNWRRFSPVYSNGYVSYVKSSNQLTNGPYTVYVASSLKAEGIGVISSIKTPGYWVKRKTNNLPQNQFSSGIGEISADMMSLTRYETFTNGNWNRDTYNGPSLHFGANVDDNIPFNGDDSYKRCVNQLLDQISLTKGSLAVSVAEIDKTAEMIADTAKRLARAYSNLRKGDVVGCASSLGLRLGRKKVKAFGRRRREYLRADGNYRRFASNTWLELTYGWRPLISDVYTQTENLANYMTARSNVTRKARARADEEKVTEVRNLSPNGFPGKVTKRIQVNRTTRMVLEFGLDGQPSLADSFGLKNPAIVAWEVVPFSFVVDWFYPVGKYLESLTATQGLVFVKGTKSTTDTIVIDSTVTASGIPPSGSSGVLWTGRGSATNKKTVKNRNIISAFPSAQLPILQDPRSISHAASAIALLNNIFLS